MKSDFAEVYDLHVWDVYGFLAYRLGSRVDAEDLTQLTFERALKAWDRFDERKAGLHTWLIAIARNALIDHYRRGVNAVEQPFSMEDTERLGPTEPGPEEGLGVAPVLATALDKLGDREREVLALRFGGDLSGPEIADMLDLSLANTQQILSRSLRKLRAELEDSGAESLRGGA